MLEAFVLVAVLIEQVVELTFGRFIGKGKAFEAQAWYLMPALTVLVSVGICLALKVAAVGVLLATVGFGSVVINPYVDFVLTGILLSAGADGWHAFRNRALPGRNPGVNPFGGR